MNRPNILIFMTDQQRACSVQPNHPYKAKTPVLDEFRKHATTFNRTYCPAPHCCPSRASFMTGLMPTQHGVWHNVNVANAISRGLKKHIRPWSVDMKQAGYRMFYSGKWHVSNFQQPRDYGWEHVFPEGHCRGEGMTIEEQNEQALETEINLLKKHAQNQWQGKRLPGEIRRPGRKQYIHYGTRENPFNDQTVVESMIGRMETLDSTDPWCLYVGTLGPHDPYVPPKRFLEMYDGIEFPLPDTFADPMSDKPGLYRRTRDKFSQLTRKEHQAAIKHYLAFCTYEDWLFGLLIEKLKQAGEYDNTMILFLSDHGDYLGDHGLWCKGLPAFLSAYHVPAIVKMPGPQQSSERNELISLMDFGPTFLEVAGIKSSIKFAGKSLLPLLRGETPNDWRDALFFQTNGNETYGIQRSILTDKWRFVFNGFDYDELYDLEKDPQQMKNLATDSTYQNTIKELYTRIWEFGMQHEV